MYTKTNPVKLDIHHISNHPNFKHSFGERIEREGKKREIEEREE
jgi:hypothetical protein